MPVAMLHGVAYPMAKYIITVNKNADAPILLRRCRRSTSRGATDRRRRARALNLQLKDAG
jgi:hypothetical protein